MVGATEELLTTRDDFTVAPHNGEQSPFTWGQIPPAEATHTINVARLCFSDTTRDSRNRGSLNAPRPFSSLHSAHKNTSTRDPDLYRLQGANPRRAWAQQLRPDRPDC
jgi:hypothetical protein